ncbi:MAG: ATP-binding protein [Victivallales bacterium]|nr:ATP-binding protein [Victivallales bacterium]
MKNLTTSIYTFEDLIRGDFLYVDKTEYVWQLIKPAKEMYFLSRPRRFGKSLLLSTLKAIFEGKKELFRGLALYDKPYDWKVHPVIHLRFADYSPMKDTAEKVEGYLLDKVATIAKAHSISLPPGCDSSTAFGKLIDAMGEKEQVVILVDEYDKPILDNIANENVGEILKCLKGFFSVLKDRNELERLLFITGVSKFSHVSLFSELNNLTDITLNPDYAGMLGFTEAEVRDCFADRLAAAASANGVAENELMRHLMEWYDGYRFSKAETHVCNPVSITKFFYNNYGFSNFWDTTGTPSFLLELMRSRSYDHEAALNDWYDESVFAAYELDRLDITGLLWQTGYLTIKEVQSDGFDMQYRLDFPDREVQETFNRRLIEFYAGEDNSREAWSCARKLMSAIRKDDLSGFMVLFQSFLACIPYDIHLPHEKYYQTIFYIVFRLLGSRVEAESRTNQGRIDAYIRTAKTVYIFEFKLDKNAKEAVGQILDRRYYEKFQGCGLPVRLVGVDFDSSKGRIDSREEGTLAADN